MAPGVRAAAAARAGGPVEAGFAARSPEIAQALRRQIRDGELSGQTSGLAAGFLQANLAILPAALAGDFLLYCTRNPKPCPLLDVGDAGDPMLPRLGRDLDVRRDLSRYRLFRDGRHVETPQDVSAAWRDDLVAFAIGCSFSFEDALQRAGIAVRHIDAGRNVPMYVTAIETRPAGPFGGPLVVSLRSFAPADAIRAVVLSDQYPLAHGAPVHIGDPARIGIADLSAPDFGDPPVVAEGDIPVFWACGVTPQMAIGRARPELAITHDPGHMLITDLPADLKA
ncbi:MAG: putative hydro-lyase [Tistlia sp.]|uniref:putative hydro-lyase n=1 Tax=Tistlia sp. TaxID=3057121 RepID=UPI0034A1E54E